MLDIIYDYYMVFVFSCYSILFYSGLLYSIPYYSVLFYSILFLCFFLFPFFISISTSISIFICMFIVIFISISISSLFSSLVFCSFLFHSIRSIFFHFYFFYFFLPFQLCFLSIFFWSCFCFCFHFYVYPISTLLCSIMFHSIYCHFLFPCPCPFPFPFPMFFGLCLFPNFWFICFYCVSLAHLQTAGSALFHTKWGCRRLPGRLSRQNPAQVLQKKMEHIAWKISWMKSAWGMLIFSVSLGHHGSELSESSTAGIWRCLVMKAFKRWRKLMKATNLANRSSSRLKLTDRIACLRCSRGWPKLKGNSLRMASRESWWSCKRASKRSISSAGRKRDCNDGSTGTGTTKRM